MFYSNNNNYMQDLYAYNQIPLNNTYNPYVGNSMPGVGNENMGFANNMNGMFAPNMNTISNMNMQNPNNLYPSIYRIINPVVNRVVSGSNLPYLTEDNLNNMVDTVYNIVEGQIDLEEQIEMASQAEPINRGTTTPTTTNTNTNTQNPSTNTTTRATTTSDTRNMMNTGTISNQTTNTTSFSRRRNRNDSLLRDLIKILILRQIFSRNWMAQMSF